MTVFDICAFRLRRRRTAGISQVAAAAVFVAAENEG
jgi:hypothetical protein